jgi:hypothetical protein
VVDQRMVENRSQVERMIELRGSENIHFVTNYQYQLTIYGIELFLAKSFS